MLYLLNVLNQTLTIIFTKHVGAPATFKNLTAKEQHELIKNS